MLVPALSLRLRGVLLLPHLAANRRFLMTTARIAGQVIGPVADLARRLVVADSLGQGSHEFCYGACADSSNSIKARAQSSTDVKTLATFFAASGSEPRNE